MVDYLDLRIYGEVSSFICSGDADDFAPKLKTAGIVIELADHERPLRQFLKNVVSGERN